MAVLPKLLINTFREYKYWSDINTSQIPQGALELYINSGMFDLHISRIRSMYSQRMSALKDIAKNQSSPAVRWHIPSKAGFYAGLEILNMSRQKYIVDALMKKDIILPNIESSYLLEHIDDRFLRLSIAKIEPKVMEPGIGLIISEIEKEANKYSSSIHL